MPVKKFPLFGIAEQLEKASKLDGAKEIYQKALEVSSSSKGQQVVDNFSSNLLVEDVKKEAQAGIERVEEKMRGKLKKIIKGRGLAIDVEVDKLKPLKEVQDLMPAISVRDFKRMAVDIRERGVQVPLVILNDSFEIICGFNRWRAAKSCDLPIVPAFIADMSREEAIKYAIQDNLNRRHMTMEEKTGLARILLQKRGKRTVGRPKQVDADKLKEAKEEGFPLTIRDIADVTGLSKSKVDREEKKMSQMGQFPKPKTFCLEKESHRFPEVKGDQLQELVEIIQTKVELLVSNLNLTIEDKIRAEITFFVKRKE